MTKGKMHAASTVAEAESFDDVPNDLVLIAGWEIVDME